jgi:NACalpha-BTF3-like transcription factor
MQEKDRIMQEKDSLREQLDAIRNGTSIHLPEANIEFVMERAHCSRDDAIMALKEVAGSYAHLDDAVALLTLKPKSNDKCIFGTDQDQM